MGIRDRKSTRLNSSHVEISYAVFCLKILRPPTSTLFPYTTLFRSYEAVWQGERSWNGVAILARHHIPVLTCTSLPGDSEDHQARYIEAAVQGVLITSIYLPNGNPRSEEHTSELQSRRDLVCRLLLENTATTYIYTLSLHDALPILRSSLARGTLLERRGHSGATPHSRADLHQLAGRL